MNNGFWNALDHHTYHLADKSSKYSDFIAENVANWAKRLQVQMKTIIFNSFDLISIIIFLATFKLACDTNGIREGAAVWYLHFFVKKPAAGALDSRIALPSKFNGRGKEGTLMEYVQVVKYFQEA